MAEGSQIEFGDREDDNGLFPIMDMLNFKVVKLNQGEKGFRDGNQLFVTPDEKYYAQEYCRLNELVQHWKSVCERTEYKVVELVNKVERLEKENGELKEKTVNLKEVESIMEDQQRVLEAMEGKQKNAKEEFEKKLEEEKRKVELKDSIIVLLETKLKKVKKESEITEKKLEDLSEFLIECNSSLEKNINSFISEFNLTCGDDDDETVDKTSENEAVHLKLKRNLCMLSGVVRKTFNEILAMGNEDNERQNISSSTKDQTNRVTDGINTDQNRDIWKPNEYDDDQYHPVCSPVTPEQYTISD